MMEALNAIWTFLSVPFGFPITYRLVPSGPFRPFVYFDPSFFSAAAAAAVRLSPVQIAQEAMNAAHAHVRRTASATSLQAASPSTPTSSSPHALRLGFLGDDPHIAGSTNCRCSSCHLRVHIFPRREDGRIVLPYPTVANRNQRRPTSGESGAVPHSLSERISVDRFSSAAGARGGISVQRSSGQVDQGEGTSRAYSQISGPGVPAGSSKPPQVITIDPHPDDLGYSREILLVERHASRSNRSKQPRKTPYQPRTKRPDPGPRSTSTHMGENRLRTQDISYSDNLVHNAARPREPEAATLPETQFPNPYAEINSTPTVSKTGRRLYWPDPYATIGEEQFPQLFTSPLVLGKRESNLSGSSATLSHKTSLSKESDERLTPDPTPSDPLSTSVALSRGDTSDIPHDRYTEPRISQIRGGARIPDPDSPRELPGQPAEDPPMLLKFNSCPNPPPAMWVSRAEEFDEDRPQHESSSPQTHTGMLRFQNPLMPDSEPATMTESPREASVVQVKWDTERKRRQGYFAQEQGVEKSPFRHYNKTSCDFDDQ